MEDSSFQRNVQNEFQFLIEDYGFDLTTVQSNVVRYSSNKVMVELNYSQKCEVDLILDQNPPSYRFQFRLFLKAFHPTAEKALGYGIAYSDDEICRELRCLSDALRRYGRPLLEFDKQVFERMKTVKWWELPS
jgi:hypothetical protein